MSDLMAVVFDFDGIIVDTETAVFEAYRLIYDVPGAILAELRDVAARRTHAVAWEPDDVLVVDNSRVMHGRRAFWSLCGITTACCICTTFW